MEDFFKEIFRMFVEYENDLTMYCFEDKLEQFHCEMPQQKELSVADKQLLKRVSDVLGANYKSKLAHLFASAVKYAETGEGTVKIKKPDGTLDAVPIAQLMGGADQKKDKLTSFLNVAKKAIDTGKKAATSVQKQLDNPNSVLNQGLQAVGQATSKSGTGDTGSPFGAIGSVLGASGIMKKVEGLLNKVESLSTLDANKVKAFMNQTVANEVIAKINEPVVKELQELNKQMKLMVEEIKKLNK